MISSIAETEVLAACRTLFGPGVRLSRDFLFYLQPSGVKSVYRRRAKETHPDLFSSLAPREQLAKAELFRELAQAYDLVNAFIKDRELNPTPSAGKYNSARPAARPRPAGARPRPTAARPRPKPASAAGASRDSGPQYYRGSMPQHSLGIGIYLYYRGVIPYRTLIQALVWQRQQRPTLGHIARNWGWLDDSDINQIVSHRSQPGRFGTKATSLGLLTAHQVQTLLFHQRSRQQRLGEYFVEKGYLPPEEMEVMVEELHQHNAKVSRGRSRN